MCLVVHEMHTIAAHLPTHHKHLPAPHFTQQEFAAEDNSDLYHEETQLQRAQQEQQQLQNRLAVPGLVNPYQAPDQDMGDL